jgi:hypothetical protein
MRESLYPTIEQITIRSPMVVLVYEHDLMVSMPYPLHGHFVRHQQVTAHFYRFTVKRPSQIRKVSILNEWNLPIPTNRGSAYLTFLWFKLVKH